MRVFISSVRRGLEDERDALPGLISAIGFEPVRFEDFGASPTPSREACLQGVASADVYVLLLGPNYGHRFADTKQSPTHDEWVAATKRGIPRLVYVKNGVEVEPDQRAFIDSIGNYGSGVFYDTFDSVAELQIKVAGALRSQATSPSDLTFTPCPTRCRSSGVVAQTRTTGMQSNPRLLRARPTCSRNSEDNETDAGTCRHIRQAYP